MTDEKLVSWIAWNMDFYGPSRMGKVAQAKPEEFLEAALRRPDFASESVKFLSGPALEKALGYLFTQGSFIDIKNAAKVRPDLAPRIQNLMVRNTYTRVRPTAYDLKSWIREVKGVDTKPMQALFAEQAYLSELVDFQCEKDSPADATTTVKILFAKGENDWVIVLCRNLPEAAGILQEILEKEIEKDRILTSSVAKFVLRVRGLDPTKMEEMIIARDPRVIPSYVQQSGRTEGPAAALAAAAYVLGQ